MQAHVQRKGFAFSLLRLPLQARSVRTTTARSHTRTCARLCTHTYRRVTGKKLNVKPGPFDLRNFRLEGRHPTAILLLILVLFLLFLRLRRALPASAPFRFLLDIFLAIVVVPAAQGRGGLSAVFDALTNAYQDIVLALVLARRAGAL